MTNENSDQYVIIPDEPLPVAAAFVGEGTGYDLDKINDANYNINEWWKNKLADQIPALLRSNYGVGNDNAFADNLYNILPVAIKFRVDEWVKNNQELAETEPDAFNTKYADTVLNYYEAVGATRKYSMLWIVETH